MKTIILFLTVLVPFCVFIKCDLKQEKKSQNPESQNPARNQNQQVPQPTLVPTQQIQHAPVQQTQPESHNQKLRQGLEGCRNAYINCQKSCEWYDDTCETQCNNNQLHCFIQYDKRCESNINLCTNNNQ